jgi:hypothetical protein
MLEAAGFSSVEIVDAKRDLNLYRKLRAKDANETSSASPCSTPGDAGAGIRDGNFDVNEYAASVRVFALK